MNESGNEMAFSPAPDKITVPLFPAEDLSLRRLTREKDSAPGCWSFAFLRFPLVPKLLFGNENCKIMMILHFYQSLVRKNDKFCK